MVSPHKRKSNKRKAGGIVAVQIWNNIPFDIHAAVTRTKVARKVKKRVVTKSTNVVVPKAKAPSAPLAPGDPPPPEQDNSQEPDRQTRKGPSHSVAVRPPFPLLYSNKLIEEPITAYSQISNNGSSTGTNLPTSSSNLKR